MITVSFFVCAKNGNPRYYCYKGCGAWFLCLVSSSGLVGIVRVFRDGRAKEGCGDRHGFGHAFGCCDPISLG
ncbi:3-oxoacyl-(acyl-carrier-) synthase II domain protein [Anaplasma phagocytophilum str. HGE2]|nr:3-oxoacyl-(acyl-carrier-) synthase II domain protein [Anaplasma phagocytophilum str. HGE2]